MVTKMRYIDFFMVIVINVSIVTSVRAEKYVVLRIAPNDAEIKVAGNPIHQNYIIDSCDKIEWDEHVEHQGMIVCLNANQNVRYVLTKEMCKQKNAQHQSLDFLLANNIVSMGKASVRGGASVRISLVAMSSDVQVLLPSKPEGKFQLRLGEVVVADNLPIDGTIVNIPFSALADYEGIHDFQLVEIVDGEDENKYDLEIEVIK